MATLWDEMIDLQGAIVTRYRNAYGTPGASTYTDRPITETSDAVFPMLIGPYNVNSPGFNTWSNTLGIGEKTDFEEVGMCKSDADIEEGDWVDDTEKKWDVKLVYTHKEFGTTVYKLAFMIRRLD